ncbi:uncharacterized protein VICG_00250 [Vittaforma corneae ATCC 50505]|uniref:Translation initiation factor beta propellor-like domain-containing protein n=1 Tax=Vittaforma corneae (strain ATCC 50505) TaxID=993615 RepID=L2GQZ5_VITCO|nr:uncharacterized protein VICG_00250 [Vittaforma corneae ATCC 50505]ELA42935.1 hypothetical protein VICG_00250 [Vittaforma corneae ATCC 50505]
MQLSENGRHLGILLHNKDLHVFKNAVEISVVQNVELFSISDSFYSITTKEETKVFSFEENTAVFEFKCAAKFLFSFSSLIIMVTEKLECQKILVFRNNKAHAILSLPNIYRAVVESTESENQFLLLVDTEYTKNSYYAESSLFLLSFADADQVAASCAKNEGSTDICIPELTTRSEDFVVIQYRGLNKIHKSGFLKDSFYVCFGDQPALLFQFDLKGKLQKKYPKSVRNTAIFNSRENRLINAGLGNLPGTIEVYCNSECTCSFEMLGASIVSWLNNDSYFLVAITNYFKSQNKIVIYDYYGNALEEMECKSLIDVRVYGQIEKEAAVDPPKEAVKIKPVSAYVPPHLQNKIVESAKAKEPAKKATRTKRRDKEAVEKELSECLKLRERLRNGEELSLEEENKIFKIKSLEEELKVLSSN